MFNKGLKWDTLNKLGQSRIFKTAFFWIFFVPLSAKFLSALNRTLTFTLFSQEITIQFSLPFSWEIFYFSSVFIAAATIIYQLKCPEIIRNYNRYSDFQNVGKGNRDLLGYFVDIIHNVPPEIKNIIFDRFKEVFIKPPGPSSFDPWEIEDSVIIPEKMGEAFWFIHNQSSYQDMVARTVVGLLYLIGILLIGIVLAQNFLFVVSQFRSLVTP